MTLPQRLAGLQLVERDLNVHRVYWLRAVAREDRVQERLELERCDKLLDRYNEIRAVAGWVEGTERDR